MSEQMPRYAVVMSTYNGQAYLESQVASVAGQAADRWRLYVRDDGSDDGTVPLVETWAAKDSRVRLLPPDGRNLGPAASYGLLLEHALECGERYVFLSDQDDVWLPGKCSSMLARMLELERALGEDCPLLVHTDLQVVDKDLKRLHPSFVALSRIDAAEPDRALRLLFGNSVTGCAALVNAALLRRALPMPRVAMHDWWLAQCAAAFGQVEFVDVQTVLYRQHGTNVVGAQGMGARAGTVLRSPGAWWQASAQRFLLGLHQLWTVRERAKSRSLALVPEVGRALDLLWEGLVIGPAWWCRVAATRRSGAMPRAPLMRILLLLRVMLLPELRRRLGDEREGISS